MAHAATSKTDPVRIVLANLIAESQTPYTPEKILREFRATVDKRRPDRELLSLLESISCKRPNYREVLAEITSTLERKDPMYALLVFAERINDDAMWPLKYGSSSNLSHPASQKNVESPAPLLDAAIHRSSSSLLQVEEQPTNASGDHARNSQLDLSTSTPVTHRKSDESLGLATVPVTTAIATYARRPVPSEPIVPRGDLSVIKKRVLNAVSNSTALTMGSIDQLLNSSSSKASNRSAGNNAAASNAASARSGVTYNLDSSPGSSPCNSHRSGMSIAISTGTSNGGNSSRAPSSRATSSGYRPLSNVFLDRCSLNNNNNNNKYLVGCKDGLPDEYRTHLLWDYYKVEPPNPMPKPELAALPPDAQQRLLLTEIIYCLSGVRGNYIVALPHDELSLGLAKYETRFSVHVHLDKSLAEMVHEILPLASHFMGIQKVIALTDGNGQVNNALNAALQNITHDFYMLLQQAEVEMLKNDLTVPKLLYYLQPTIWVIDEIWTTLAELDMHDYHGAAVLSHLCDRIKHLEGDKYAQELIIGLARKAAEPYMRMLQLWIQKGIIVDSTHEFLVEDNEVIHKDELPEHYSDDYWEKRYTVRTECIPTFLEKYADKILRTGKYLNVIRQCGKRVMPTQQMNLEFDPTSELHVHVINDAYYFAARMLLDVLLTENDLMGHLQSVKRYLLLNQGDFTMQFMDACEDELAKNVDLVLPMTLENLLGLTLRLSSARSDPYKDDLHCELLTYDLVTQMSKIMNQKEEYWKTTDRLDLSGLECFAFTYEVKWPVSLVLNHIAITKYQMLFRQLFYCKHVERQLCKIWKENSIAKKFSPHAAELYRSAFTLRQRMMNAVQNLEYYMMIEIIEPNWHIFIEKMKNVENVDMVLSLHQDFLDLCLKNCMLTETSHLNRAIFKLCKICLKFCEFIQSESTLDETDTFAERVKRFDLEFTGMLISFLKQINDLAKDNTADRFMNLVHRINFNGFYSEQMEKLCVKNAMG
ncbi:gamma-tubulin complex component 2 homolog isoform X3 [Drosophila novamexicana]|uniref:gamma-tubulin complex component 2 homolog isoform X3 n=1 Tax=Drosophila novamexicana TaxID=47314 RepID=UPI0011E5D4AB|nr:gamma-tubulin complex component 2 homolog isoform X3 [Drosophila novamexicana]